MTLVELLIVLGIIAVLGALLFPVFARARAISHRAACASNMHQCALAITIYTQDYDGTFMDYRTDIRCYYNGKNGELYWHNHFCEGELDSNFETTWSTLALPYINASRSATMMDSGFYSAPTFFCPADNDRDKRPVTSYEYKMWLADGHSEPEIFSAPQLAMLWEPVTYHQSKLYTEHQREAEMNIVFADGHTHWVHLSQTTSALYSTHGPDLHWTFGGVGARHAYAGADLLEY